MTRSNNSKMVSSSALNSSQAKLFPEDLPSQVGSSGSRALQGNISLPEQQPGLVSHGNLPRGFEGTQPSNLSRLNISRIPLIGWKSPPRFTIDSDLRVVAGEESLEIDAQNERELRVSAAIYPRPSAIPPNPTLLVEDSIHNDHNTPVVPITAEIEEEVSVPGGLVSEEITAVALQPLESVGNIALAVAIIATLKDLASQNHSLSRIDFNLAGQILRDPELVKLILEKFNIGSSSTPTPHTDPPPPTPSMSLSLPTSQAGITVSNSFDTTTVSRPQTICSVPATASSSYPRTVFSPESESLLQPNRVESRGRLLPSETDEDVEILLHKYGVCTNIGACTCQEPLNFPDLKQKKKKPCQYFNTSRGCRHGANCLFKHSGQGASGSSDAKRAKRDG